LIDHRETHKFPSPLISLAAPSLARLEVDLEPPEHDHGDIEIAPFDFIKYEVDKIIAVMEIDHIYGLFREIAELLDVIGERLQHYFHSYKMVEGQDLGIEIPTMA